MIQNKLREGERIDELQRNAYVIIQDPKRFCFGMDAVLLSGFAQVKHGETVLDLGTGTGILPILLEAKTEGKHFTGLEIQPESADMADRSVQLNHLESKIKIVTGDIKDASKIFGASSFDVITTNKTAKRIKASEILLTGRAKRGNTLLKKVKSVDYHVLRVIPMEARDVLVLKSDSELREIKNSDIPIMDLVSTGSTISKYMIEDAFKKIELQKNEEKIEVLEEEKVTKELTIDDFLEDFKL